MPVVPQAAPEPQPGTQVRRHALLALLVASAFILYIDRGNLSIAAPMVKDELGLSPEKLGILLSAFFWTYAGLQPFAGWIVDRLDVFYVLAGGFFLWSGATVATGFGHTFAVLLAIRLVLGIGESVAYPSYSKILARYFHDKQRGVANAMIASGVLLGPGTGILFGGVLMAKFGWRPFFVVLGFISLAWMPAWLALRPREAPLTVRTANDAITIRQFLRLRSAWGACAGHFSSNYFSYFLISWLPYYLVRERNFSMQNMAEIGAATYFVAAIASTSAGWLSDRLVQAGYDNTRVRKTFTGGGLACAAIFLTLAGVAGPKLAAVAVMLATISYSACGSHIFLIAQTLAGPAAAGRWSGMQNFAGNFAGPLAPAVTGWAIERAGNFSLAFAITTAVLLFGAVSWTMVMGRVEEVDWEANRA